MNDVKSTILCGGSYHRIVLTSRGRLQFASHTITELNNQIAMAKLGGYDPCECATFLRQWREATATSTSKIPMPFQALRVRQVGGSERLTRFVLEGFRRRKQSASKALLAAADEQVRVCGEVPVEELPVMFANALAGRLVSLGMEVFQNYPTREEQKFDIELHVRCNEVRVVNQMRFEKGPGRSIKVYGPELSVNVVASQPHGVPAGLDKIVYRIVWDYFTTIYRSQPGGEMLPALPLGDLPLAVSDAVKHENGSRRFGISMFELGPLNGFATKLLLSKFQALSPLFRKLLAVSARTQIQGRYAAQPDQDKAT